MTGYNFNAPVIQIFNTVTLKTTTTSSSPISPPSNESRTSSSYFIVIVISVICAVILVTCAALLFFCRKQKQIELEKQKGLEKQKDKQFEKKKELQEISIKNENQFASGQNIKPPTVFHCQWGCIYTTNQDKLFKKHKDAHETQSLLLKAFCSKCSFKAENKEAITFHLENHHL